MRPATGLQQPLRCAPAFRPDARASPTCVVEAKTTVNARFFFSPTVKVGETRPS